MGIFLLTKLHALSLFLSFYFIQKQRCVPTHINHRKYFTFEALTVESLEPSTDYSVVRKSSNEKYFPLKVEIIIIVVAYFSLI